MVWKDLIGALISFLVFGLIIFGFVLWARADENYREKKTVSKYMQLIM